MLINEIFDILAAIFPIIYLDKTWFRQKEHVLYIILGMDSKLIQFRRWRATIAIAMVLSWMKNWKRWLKCKQQKPICLLEAIELNCKFTICKIVVLCDSSLPRHHIIIKKDFVSFSVMSFNQVSIWKILKI